MPGSAIMPPRAPMPRRYENLRGLRQGFANRAPAISPALVPAFTAGFVAAL
jgi:hypothetical protein